MSESGLHVLHVYDGHERVHDGEGSVPNVVWNVARETAARGHQVTILERQWKELPTVAEHEGVAFRRIDLRTGADDPWERVPYEQITSPLGLGQLVSDRINFALATLPHLHYLDYDVLHVHLPFAANVLIHLYPFTRSQTIYTAHVGEEQKRFGLDTGEETPLPLRFFSPDIHLMKRIAKPVVLNDRLQKTLEQTKDIDATVIANGIDLEKFPASLDDTNRVRREYNIEAPTVMFSGTITPQKGVEVLVKAAKRVEKTTDQDVTFLLVGDDKLDERYANRMKEYVRTEGLDDIVQFTGYIPYDDLKALYTACDVFVLPSYEEGMPLVLLEALASGKPLVGSDIGGIAMQIREGENGFLFSPGDEDELADHLRTLVDDPGRRREMGQASRQIAENEFGWPDIVDQYISAYEELV